MENTQLATLISAILAGFGTLAGVVRWAVTRIVKAMDDQSSSNLRLADAQIELAGALAAQRADIDHISRWIMMHTPKMPTTTPTMANLRAIEDDEQTRDERPGSDRRRNVGPKRRTTTAVRGVPLEPRRPGTHDDDR